MCVWGVGGIGRVLGEAGLGLGVVFGNNPKYWDRQLSEPCRHRPDATVHDI